MSVVAGVALAAGAVAGAAVAWWWRGRRGGCDWMGAPFPAVLCDADTGRPLGANPAARALLGLVEGALPPTLGDLASRAADSDGAADVVWAHPSGVTVALHVHQRLITHRGRSARLLALFDVTSRRADESELRRRLRTEHMLAAVSKLFLDEGTIDHDVAEALRMIGEHLEVDRAYIYLYERDSDQFHHAYSWLAPGAARLTSVMPQNLGDLFPWMQQEILSSRTVSLPRFDGIPSSPSGERPAPGGFDVASLLSAPMVYQGEVVGFIAVDMVATTREWTPGEETALHLVGELVANVLRRRRAEQDLRRAQEELALKVRRLQLLRDFNSAIAASLDLKTVLATFNELVPEGCRDLGVDRVTLLLFDESGSTLRSDAVDADLPNIQTITSAHSPATALARRCIEENEAIFIPDAAHSDLIAPEVAAAQGIRSALALPVTIKGRPVGAVRIDKRESSQAFNEADLEFFRLLADQLGVVVENARLFSEARAAAEEARRKEAQYRLLAENITDVIWTTDTTGRYLYISPSCTSLFGYTPEELMSQSALHALTPGGLRRPDPQAATEPAGLAHLALSGHSQLMEIRQRRRDGRMIWTETQITPLRDAGGVLIGHLGVTRDITSRKESEGQLRASMARFRQLFEQANDAIFLLSMDETIVDCNRQASTLFGRAREEFPNMRWADLLAVPPDVPLSAQAREPAADSAPFELLALRSNRTTIHLEASATYLDAAGEELILLIARDITDRKLAERRQKLFVRWLRGVASAADQLISSRSEEIPYRAAVELARQQLGLPRCAIYLRIGSRIRGTWGCDADGNIVNESSLSLPATEEWNALFRPRRPTESRSAIQRFERFQFLDGKVEELGADYVLIAQVLNSQLQPVAVIIADPSPGVEAADQADMLSIYASLLGGIFETKLNQGALKMSEERARRAFQAKQREMDKIAAVHSRLLPTRFDPIAGLEFAAYCRPSADIGGDFYYAAPLPDGRAVICMADVSGHGAKAAVATATSRALLCAALMEMSPGDGPARLLYRISVWLQDQLDVEQFVTMWLGVWDSSTGTLSYSSCAHPAAVLARPGQHPLFLPQETALPVGLSGVEPNPPPEQYLQLLPGDRVIVYTDGWVETPSVDGRFLEGDALLGLIEESDGQPLAQIPIFLCTAFEHHVANTRIADDVTLLVFERTV